MLTFLNIFIIFCIFVIGTLFGSFFSLATYRIPRHQDIVATRSYCTSCKHRLGFFDLIPVLSYIIRGGKCKYCKDKISLRYFFLEVGNGIIFVVMYLMFGYSFNFLIAAILYVAIFMIIGTYIMDKNMSDEERVNLKKDIKTVNKKDVNKVNNSMRKRSGVFISELVIAMILFTMLLVSSFIMSRNYNTKAAQLIADANAQTIAIKNIEICLATDYDKLNSYRLEEKIDGINYTVNTEVYKYSDKDFSKSDIVKNVEVKVSYVVSGKSYDYNLKTLKGKVL